MLYNEKYNHFSDNELITEYKHTKNNVFVGMLYKRYAHLVLGLSLKYLKDEDEAKDAVMQIFEKLLADLLKFNIEYFKSWLYTFSKNHCLMILRNQQSKLKKEINLEVHADLFMETESSSHLNQASEKEIQYTLLEKAIEELNEDQRKCIMLFYLKETWLIFHLCHTSSHASQARTGTEFARSARRNYFPGFSVLAPTRD